jgi:PAS domain S-box-containing protein
MTGQADDVSRVQARLSRTLYELSTSAGRGLDPAELVNLVAEHACELVRADAVAVYLWDEASGLLLPVYTNDSRLPLSDRPLRADEGATGLAVRRGEIVVIDDYAHFEHAVDWALAGGLRSAVAVPLLVAGRATGALVIRFYGEKPLTGADEERMLSVLAALAAPALEAARLYASSSLEREHERTLREITSALAENLDERNVLELAVERSAQLLQSPYARVWLFEPSGELSCAAAKGYLSDRTFIDRLAYDSTSGMAARQQIVNLTNAPAEGGWRFNREFGERTGIGAYLGAGLWRAGKSLGVLEVMRETGHRYSEAEQQLLVSLANAVAVAVSNARTHGAAERLAREAEARAAAVAESERVLRSVYEAIGSGVLVMDPRGVVVTANAAAEEILGVPAARLIGGPPGVIETQLLADGSLVPIHERPGPRAARTGQAERKLIFSFVHSDHRRRWIQVDVVPLFGPDGQVSRVVSSFIDITEQKQSEEALRRRDAILQAVAFAAEKLLTTPEWELSIDEVLRHLGAATGVSRVYIVPSASASEADYHEWTAEDVAPRADMPEQGSYLRALGLSRWERILREGGIVQGQLRSFPVEEEAKLVAQGVCSVLVVPIFVGSTWWGFIGFDDCVEERSWQANMVEALKTAAGTLGAAIYRRRAEAERLQLVREQSARVEAEAAQRRMAFLAEASQRLAASLDYETSLQAVADLVVPALADACFFDVVQLNGELRRVAAAGTESRPVLSLDDGVSRLAPRELSVPLVTHAGPAGTLTWVAQGSRPAFQATDLDLAEHLARRCSLAIDNSRLYREARAAVSLRDEFLSVAAHELKTPMTSLRGYAQLLAREYARAEASPERARRAAHTIQVQSDKLARLVAQLLDVSRLQSGKLAIERTPTDVSDLLRGIVETTRTQLKDHTLLARLPSDLWAQIDPLRVEQVVTNLIDNAIKYSPEGGQIDLTLECDRQENALRISVRDRGVGVPPEHRAHIFDRFYQAHAGGALTSMAGMGLGLYISRQIVELHDGTIEAEFPDDGGTRFVVTLPLPSEVADRKHREAHHPSD